MALIEVVVVSVAGVTRDAGFPYLAPTLLCPYYSTLLYYPILKLGKKCHESPTTTKPLRRNDFGGDTWVILLLFAPEKCHAPQVTLLRGDTSPERAKEVSPCKCHPLHATFACRLYSSGKRTGVPLSPAFACLSRIAFMLGFSSQSAAIFSLITPFEGVALVVFPSRFRLINPAPWNAKPEKLRTTPA